MKSFFSMFAKSLSELKQVRNLVITAFFIAVSMAVEMYSIDLGFSKINFAFLAIAVIGMLFGPSVGFIAGCGCDVVGYLVHPDGGFLPVYIIVAGLQGMIYGICLYRRNDSHSILFVNNATEKSLDITLYLRALAARLIDVVLINLLINTKLNLHYHFIPQEAYGTAVIARTTKNVIELVADIPMLFVLLPIALTAYNRLGSLKRAAN